MHLFSLVRQLSERWVNHDNTRSAAAIAYFAIFMLAPMLVFAAVALSHFVGSTQAKTILQAKLGETIGPAGAEVAQEVFSNSSFTGSITVTSAISGILLLYAASAIFVELRNTLNRIFGLPVRSTREAIFSFLFGRLIAALSVIIAGTLLVTTLFAQLLIRTISSQWFPNLDFSGPLWNITTGGFTLLIVFGVIAMIFKLLPSQRPAWHHVLLGATVSVILFEFGRWLIGFYVSRSVITSTYGTSGAIVAFVVWIFYTAQILILGAEICQLSAERAKARCAQSPS